MPRALWSSTPVAGAKTAFLAALVDLGAPPSPILRAAAGVAGYVEIRFEAAAAGTRATLDADAGTAQAVLGAALDEALRRLGAPRVVEGPEPAWSGYVARGAGEDSRTSARVEVALGEVTPT